MAKWAAAISERIPAGATVLDLASGTGILGLLALRSGAAKVHAVECGSIFDLGSRIAAENHAAVQNIRGFSTAVTLPEKVDVIVADQVGYFGFNAGIFEYFADAVQRFLKPGGITLPHSIEFHCAPMEAPEEFEKIDFWRRKPSGFSMQSAWETAVNSTHPFRSDPEQLLSLPLASPEIPLNPTYTGLVRIQGEVEIYRDATVHGLVGFFNAHLTPNVAMTNSPLAAERINRANSFLPLATPIPVRAGEKLRISVLIRPVEQLVTWTVGGVRQSTFQSLNLDGHRRFDPASRPTLSPRAHARRFVLDRCVGRLTLNEIATALCAEFPEIFPTQSAAIAFAARQSD